LMAGHGAQAGPGIGVVGAGSMGRWHAHAVHKVGGRVLAVLDARPEAAQNLARHYPGAQPTSDIAKMRALGIEAVHICTPVAQHADHAYAAIRSGLHALIEKPMTSSADETLDLYVAADAAGVVLCPVHQAAFQTGVERTADLLQRLGPVRQIAFTICSAGGIGRVPHELDEIVADILPHPLSLLRRLWPGLPLDSEGWSLEHPGAGELLVSGTHGGALMSCALSLAARPTKFDLTIRCDAGTVQLDLFHGYAVAYPGAVSRLRKVAQPFAGSTRLFGAASANLVRRTFRREPAYPGLRELVLGFYDAIRSGCPAPVTPADAMAIAIARDVVIRKLGLPTSRSCR
jgi:predicted dehydrogenase